jgi:site-specific DNA recombinase
VISQTHIGCANARNKGTCTVRRSIKRTTLENIVLDGLKHQIMDPELCKIFAEEYVRELTRLHAQNRNSQASLSTELEKVDRDLEKLVDAICAGIPADRIKDIMVSLEARKAVLGDKLETSPVANFLIHPNMGRFYRERVAQLANTLRSDYSRSEASEILRGLVDTITVQFDENGKSQISIQGSLAGILSLSKANKKAVSVSEDDVQQIKLVAGAGYGEASTMEVIVMNV